MNKTGDFIIRVYGIVTNGNGEILITDEFVLDTKMTKFPGGGLELGEGLTDCLIREFREECNGQELQNIHHFYTTDFYQKALFYDNAQLISVYFTANLKPPIRFKISEIPFDFDKMENGNQSFRWVKINNLNKKEFTFPIDKFVVQKLKEKFAG
ncbi:MAG: NUDIX domain-containing protein [Bacteroidota bacterium]